MSLNLFGKILVKLRIMWYWQKNNVFDFGYNVWNPLTWVWIVIQLIIMIPLSMFSDETYPEIVHEIFKSIKTRKGD